MIIIITLYMLYISTMMSVLEVLTVTVPVLLTVAFITIAERKTMASMQRRLGPNAVGHTNSNITFKRFYHSSFGDLRELQRNRIAPVIEFSHHVLFTCTGLLNSSLANSFFKPLKGKELFICLDIKKDPNLFYIGRAKDFYKRFKNHVNSELKDRFHKFAKSTGGDNFSFFYC